MMPNSFDGEEYGTKGILENNFVSYNATNGESFTVPTDWSVIITFNNWQEGELQIVTWAR
jgi:hypothetical protein